MNEMVLEVSMSYKIVADSCCEFPAEYEKDPHYERVPLGLEVEDELIMDEKSGDVTEMSEILLSLPGEIYGGLPDGSGERVCLYPVLQVKRQLQQCGAGQKAVS